MEKQECLFLQVTGYCKVTLLLQAVTFRDANFLNVNKHNPGELAYMDFPDGKLLISIKDYLPGIFHNPTQNLMAWFQVAD